MLVLTFSPRLGRFILQLIENADLIIQIAEPSSNCTALLFDSASAYSNIRIVHIGTRRLEVSNSFKERTDALFSRSSELGRKNAERNSRIEQVRNSGVLLAQVVLYRTYPIQRSL